MKEILLSVRKRAAAIKARSFLAILALFVGFFSPEAKAFTAYPNDSAWVDSTISHCIKVIGWANIVGVTILVAIIEFYAAMWALRRVRAFFGR